MYVSPSKMQAPWKGEASSFSNTVISVPIQSKLPIVQVA